MVLKEALRDVSNWIALTAVLIALLSYCNSEESLDLSREIREEAIADRVYVDGEWFGDKVYVGTLHEAKLLPSIKGEPPWEGLEAYVKLKVSNVSQHPITIEKIRCDYLLDHGQLTTRYGSTFRALDGEEFMEFPITLDVREVFQCVTRIPLPVKAKVASKLACLNADSVYSSLDLIAWFLAAGAFDTSKAASDSTTKAKLMVVHDVCLDSLQSLEQIGMGLRHLPELLTQDGFFNSSKAAGERSLCVVITLASGTEVFDTLDYLEIDRSAVEWFADPRPGM